MCDDSKLLREFSLTTKARYMDISSRRVAQTVSRFDVLELVKNIRCFSIAFFLPREVSAVDKKYGIKVWKLVQATSVSVVHEDR